MKAPSGIEPDGFLVNPFENQPARGLIHTRAGGFPVDRQLSKFLIGGEIEIGRVLQKLLEFDLERGLNGLLSFARESRAQPTLKTIQIGLLRCIRQAAPMVLLSPSPISLVIHSARRGHGSKHPK